MLRLFYASLLALALAPSLPAADVAAGPEGARVTLDGGTVIESRAGKWVKVSAQAVAANRTSCPGGCVPYSQTAHGSNCGSMGCPANNGSGGCPCAAPAHPQFLPAAYPAYQFAPAYAFPALGGCPNGRCPR